MARNHFRVDLGYEEQMGLSLFNDFTGGFNSLRRNHRDLPYGSDVVDTLSDQISSLSLIRPKPRTIPSPLPSSFQLFRPQDLSSANHIINGCPKADQFYELHLSRLRKNESQQDRARVLRRQEARLDKRGLAHRNVNVLKESVGTGVFHPLQRPTTSKPVVTSFKKRNQRDWNQKSVKVVMNKERRVMSTTEQQQQKQKQDECHYHLPSDMDISKDWTF